MATWQFNMRNFNAASVKTSNVSQCFPFFPVFSCFPSVFPFSPVFSHFPSIFQFFPAFSRFLWCFPDWSACET